MTNADRDNPDHRSDEISARPSAPTRNATWRYLGERTAADQAYCVRFGVNHAPEPSVAPGGAWAYALPESDLGR